MVSHERDDGPPSPRPVPRNAADDAARRVLDALAVAAREIALGPAALPLDRFGRDTLDALVEARRACCDAYDKLALRLSETPNSPRSAPHPTARISFSDLVGQEPSFIACLDLARRAALSDVPIVITGETGTGKEMLAQAIHNASLRARAPFVGINVAALPRELLESELFGYERGAFSGARNTGKPGLLEIAEDGTVLLDEVGDMPLDLQAKLLRVLQERRVVRVGGTREIAIRARVIAATHRDLRRASEAGTFRADLYYRLRGVHLRLPPLRDRPGDIPLLVDACLERFAARTGRPRPTVAPRVMAAYKAHDWPGNVRELTHLIEAEASLLRPGETHILRMPTTFVGQSPIEAPVSSGVVSTAAPATLPSVPPPPPPGSDPGAILEEAQRREIAEALSRFGGNIAKAARSLGVARGTMYNRMRRLGMEPREPEILDPSAPPSSDPDRTRGRG